MVGAAQSAWWSWTAVKFPESKRGYEGAAEGCELRVKRWILEQSDRKRVQPHEDHARRVPRLLL